MLTQFLNFFCIEDVFGYRYLLHFNHINCRKNYLLLTRLKVSNVKILSLEGEPYREHHGDKPFNTFST